MIAAGTIPQMALQPSLGTPSPRFLCPVSPYAVTIGGMAYDSLADFLEELAGRGALVRVSAEVDARLEIAEITRRVARNGGPALLFDRVRGQSIAVVTNLLGTEERVCRALGVESLDEIAQRTEALILKHTPQNWFDRLKMSGDDAGVNKFRAKTVKNGPCGQVVRLGRDIDLATLPLLTQWPIESGGVVTAGQLITQDRGAEQRSVTRCPLQALDQNRLAVVDDGHSAFARHWANYLAAGEKMPAAVVLGGDPAAIVAAHIETPEGVDAYHLTGLLRGRAVDVVRCRTHALEVPADADLILEGYVDPAAELATVASAPAGSHYQVTRPAVVLHLTSIMHRSHPLFPALIDGGSHGEAAALVKVRERMLLPALRAVAPEIVDLHLPAYGGPHHFALVAIRKTGPFQARQVASALWGSPALRFTKFLVVVDHYVDVHDTDRVWSEVGANVAPERDLFTYDGPAHGSDHANSLAPLARHVGIDATAKIPGERSTDGPTPLATNPEIEQLVNSRWEEYKLAREPGEK